jgi:hypothetical protein
MFGACDAVVSYSRRGIRRFGLPSRHAWRMTKCAEYLYALYAGSLADPGDRNPFAGRSLVLAKLWMRGYMRMMQVRIETGPAMAWYLEVRRGA